MLRKKEQEKDKEKEEEVTKKSIVSTNWNS